MSDVPNDVFREVLRRIPVETLFISRRVCKAWRNIIDDPDFAKLHFNRGLGDDYLILRNNTGKVYLLSLHRFNSRPKMCVEKLLAINIKNMTGRCVPRVSSLPVPSCNGLILISTCKKNFVWLVWNPFTDEYLEIPQCDEFPVVKLGHSQVPYSGIGYDEGTDDYKIVRIVQPHTFIYSLRMKNWRKIDGFPDFRIWTDKNGVFAYGALHWVITTMECVSRGWIIALDLSTESYRTLPLPSGINERSLFSLSLYAFGDDLFLSCDKLDEHYVVWMIKDYGRDNTWVKMVTVEKTESSFVLVRPIAYLKSKGLFLLHAKLDDVFFWYDVEKKCSTKFSFDSRDHFSCQVSPLSLVRLSKSDGSYEGVT